jgi:CubicO group peptidase (beta-lactamase class C family)
MTDWIDVALYAVLLGIMWFGLPGVNARYALPVIEHRNPDWLAAHHAVARRKAESPWFQRSCLVLGSLSLAALVAVKIGAWPAALSAPAFEPERWMVLSDVFTMLAMVWVVYFMSAGALFNRWLTREVPLTARRKATLEPRSLDAYVPRPLQLVVFLLVGLHLAAWVVTGVLGLYSTSAFWGTLPFQFVIALILLFIARAIAQRRPNVMDQIFGSAFRRTEVRYAFVAQLVPLMNGCARLYEQWTGTPAPALDRASRLGLVIVMIGMTIPLFRFIWSSSHPAGRQGVRSAASSRGVSVWLLALLIGAAAASGTATSAAAAQAPAPTAGLSDEEIRKILVERVDVYRQSVGIVVGVIAPTGRRVIAHGTRAKGDPRPVDGDTVFEIGSITKVFTSLLLADAVRRGEVSLTDPVARLLPAGVKVPERGRAIMLQDLSTHTSGLPRMPGNIRPKDAANPYADYSVEQLYQFLSTHQLTRDVGAAFEYSNLGAGLLGHALARRAAMDYDSLVSARITGPLGMRRTAIALTPEMKAQLATGHSPSLEPVPNWDLPTLAGAGALRSTTNDMLTFLAAALGYGSSPLGPAFADMVATRRPTGSPTMEAALGWQILKAQGTEIVWHNGGTAGYRTWIGYEPRARTGVVVLTNVGTTAGPDDIGRHLLVPSLPLLQTFAAPPKPRIATTVAPAVFDRFVGRYQFAPAALMTITRDGSRFFAQLTGQEAFEIFAESEREYFVKLVDAQLTFEADPQGKVVAVVLHQNGKDQRAPRLEGDPVVPKAIVLDAAVLERYVGRYQLAPGAAITITRQEGRLFAQPTGQAAQEIFASSEREFFLKVINAQLRFEVDATGRATALVLLPSGTRAPRED